MDEGGVDWVAGVWLTFVFIVRMEDSAGGCRLSRCIPVLSNLAKGNIEGRWHFEWHFDNLASRECTFKYRIVAV